MKQLDEEAAHFWDRPVDPKWYAKPEDKLSVTNWFDRIGWDISETKAKTWNQVRDKMKADCGMMSKDGQEFDIYLEIMKPYFNLIKYWEDKGYLPRGIEG